MFREIYISRTKEEEEEEILVISDPILNQRCLILKLKHPYLTSLLRTKAVRGDRGVSISVSDIVDL